jgi:hypothetical protein
VLGVCGSMPFWGKSLLLGQVNKALSRSGHNKPLDDAATTTSCLRKPTCAGPPRSAHHRNWSRK